MTGIGPHLDVDKLLALAAAPDSLDVRPAAGSPPEPAYREYEVLIPHPRRKIKAAGKS